jgi:hypothetical protein
MSTDLAHRIAQAISKIAAIRDSVSTANTVSPDVEEAASEAYYEAIELMGQWLDAHESGAVELVLERLREMDVAHADLAQETLLAITHSAAEEPSTEGLGQSLRLPEDPVGLVSFVVPLVFVPKNTDAVNKLPSQELGKAENAETWGQIIGALRQCGLVSDSTMVVLHSHLHEPDRLAAADPSVVREFPRKLARGIVNRDVVVPLGYEEGERVSTHALEPVQVRCLVGTLLLTQDEQSFLDDDALGNPDLAMALSSLSSIIEEAVESAYPQWAVSCMDPEVFYDGLNTALMASAEYWALTALNDRLEDHKLKPEDVRAIVGLVRDKHGALFAQVSFCTKIDDTLVCGLTLPVDALARVMAETEIGETFASMVDAVLSDDDVTRTSCNKEIRAMTQDESGRDLYLTPGGKLKCVAPVPAVGTPTSKRSLFVDKEALELSAVPHRRVLH